MPIALALLLLILAVGCRGEIQPAAIDLPDGFRFDVYAADVPNARSLALGADGTVFVGSRAAGRVYALRDEDGDGRAERVLVLAEGLDQPNGVDFRDGDLYVAEVGRISRLPDIERRLQDPPPLEPLFELPEYDHHGWRYLKLGPDGRIYVALGAPCNVCEEYGAIWRLDRTTQSKEVFAQGVRNSVGFDWHPRSGELWFTDNGRDWLGDERPPDELNHAPEPGLHFGFPYCHGGDIPDPEYGAAGICDRFVAPARRLGPHVAALGMRFYTGERFPAEYRGQIFIAEHGSWNRSDKIGYRVMLVRLRDGEAVSYEPFATGWLRNGTAWGRPVDLLVMPDGALLVSDDAAGAVYRISYDEGSPGSTAD